MAFSIGGFGNNIGNNYNTGFPPPPPPPQGQGGMQGIQGQFPPPPPPPPPQSNGQDGCSGLDGTSFSNDALSSLTGGGINNQLNQILQSLMQGGNSAF